MHTCLRMNSMNNIRESRNITSLVIAFYSIITIKALQYAVLWFPFPIALASTSNHVPDCSVQCAIRTRNPETTVHRRLAQEHIGHPFFDTADHTSCMYTQHLHHCILVQSELNHVRPAQSTQLCQLKARSAEHRHTP